MQQRFISAIFSRKIAGISILLNRENGRPIIIDFGSTGCVPCQMMAPVLKDLTSEYQGEIDIQFIDIGGLIMTGFGLMTVIGGRVSGYVAGGFLFHGQRRGGDRSWGKAKLFMYYGLALAVTLVVSFLINPGLRGGK